MFDLSSLRFTFLIIFPLVGLILRIYLNNKIYMYLAITSIFIGSLLGLLDNHDKFLALLFFIAIFCSLMGDLMMGEIINITSNRIINGIIFFGIAQLLYISAFLGLTSFELHFNLYIPLMLVPAFVLAILHREINGSGISNKWVLIYSLTLVGLIFVTINNLMIHGSSISTHLGVLGSCSFMISDFLIAYNEFKNEFKHSKMLIETTYVFAQMCLQGSFFLL